LVAGVDLRRRAESQLPRGLNLGRGIRDPVLDGLLLGQRAAERTPRERPLAHQLEGALRLPEPSHAMVDASGPEALLRNLERLSPRSEQVRERHPAIVVAN